jgi:hypothetical protein
MKFAPTALPGVARLSLDRVADSRGFFARLHGPEEFAAAGFPFAPLQTSLSRNDAAFTLRGLHFQAPPHDEAKLVRVVRGAAFDVVVDLRRDSPTYRRWIAVTLSADNGEALLIPPLRRPGDRNRLARRAARHRAGRPRLAAADGLNPDAACVSTAPQRAGGSAVSSRDARPRT